MPTHAIAQHPASPITQLAAAEGNREQTAVIGFLASFSNPRTRGQYENDLRLYYQWCQTHGINMLDVTRAQLELYLRTMENHVSDRTGRPLAQATIGRRFGVVATFLEYAEGDDLIAKNPARRVRRPKIDRERQRRTWLDVGDFLVFVRAARTASPQDRAIIEVMATTALRVGELCSLRVGDVHLDHGTVYLEYTRKGNRLTRDKISMDTYMVLAPLLTDRDPAEPLFLNRGGRPLDRRCVQRVIDRVKTRAGVDRPLTPHGMRRTFVTAAAALGVPMDQIQQAVHHSDLRTTLLYRMRSNEGALARNTINDLLATAG